MQIVNLSPEAILYLAEAATRADAQGRRLRVAFNPPTKDAPASLSYKVGEGMWSPPWYDTEDPYRDLSKARKETIANTVGDPSKAHH